ncbi:Cyclin-B1-1 [Ananas comosus]|uniref:Cyclin-B1-1 n=1 Tax=Ananas comosus TaxID=4615 RepID=A0A199VSZ1_ANACO|nr:Cyclin-B1-1 [Ananas comosus]
MRTHRVMRRLICTCDFLNGRARQKIEKEMVSVGSLRTADVNQITTAKTILNCPKKKKYISYLNKKKEATKQVSATTTTAAAVAANVGSRGKPSRKKVHTFTSVLTARSKDACGLTGKPKELVQDIDVSDADDQLAVVDYVEDIYNMRASRPHDYIDSQVEIDAKMGAILADWIIEVHHKFELMPKTLYLTFYVIDRYLSMEMVPRRELQLVGVGAMLIACKYEEIWAPEVEEQI